MKYDLKNDPNSQDTNIPKHTEYLFINSFNEYNHFNSS